MNVQVIKVNGIKQTSIGEEYILLKYEMDTKDILKLYVIDHKKIAESFKNKSLRGILPKGRTVMLPKKGINEKMQLNRFRITDTSENIKKYFESQDKEKLWHCIVRLKRLQ